MLPSKWAPAYHNLDAEDLLFLGLHLILWMLTPSHVRRQHAANTEERRTRKCRL